MGKIGSVFGSGLAVRAPDNEAASAGGPGSDGIGKTKSRSTVFIIGCFLAIAMLAATIGVILTKFKIVIFG